MTREEAQHECERLARESPDRETHRWMPRQEGADTWSVVKVNLPPGDLLKLTPETRADPKPPEGEDPRPGFFRNIPPFGA